MVNLHQIAMYLLWNPKKNVFLNPLVYFSWFFACILLGEITHCQRHADLGPQHPSRHPSASCSSSPPVVIPLGCGCCMPATKATEEPRPVATWDQQKMVLECNGSKFQELWYTDVYCISQQKVDDSPDWLILIILDQIYWPQVAMPLEIILNQALGCTLSPTSTRTCRQWLWRFVEPRLAAVSTETDAKSHT